MFVTSSFTSGPGIILIICTRISVCTCQELSKAMMVLAATWLSCEDTHKETFFFPTEHMRRLFPFCSESGACHSERGMRECENLSLLFISCKVNSMNVVLAISKECP